MQGGKCSSNTSLPELLQWGGRGISILSELLLEVQSPDTELFLVCFPPFVGSSGSGPPQLYCHLPLFVRPQKLKRKGEIFPLILWVRAITKVALVTQEVSALAW